MFTDIMRRIFPGSRYDLFMCLRCWILKRADLLLVLIAIIYSLPTLGYPFGRDQAAHFYVGREWLNGLLPYRDVFDHKPPGIHLIYAATTMLFGARQWSIRVAEIAALIGMGLIAVYVVRRDGAPLRGEKGIIWLLAAGFYFTCFDYWDTAQVETWEGLALIASYAVAEKDGQWLRRAALSGILAGTAFIFKFPAAIVAMVIAAVIALRAWQARGGSRMLRTLVSLVLYAGSALALIGLVIGYFALQGGLGAMADMLIGFNADYLMNKPTSIDLARHWSAKFWFGSCRIWGSLILVSWVSGVLLAARRRAWQVVRGALTAMLVCLCAGVSVLLQGKFYSYHWGVMVPFMIVCAGYGVAECVRRWPKTALAGALGGLLIGFVWAAPWPANNAVSYRTITTSFWHYVRGYCGRNAYLEPFTGGYNYNYRVQEIIGDMIRDRARPGDQLIVKGFEPAIYAVSGLRSPSRFFVEIPFIDPWLQYGQSVWREEHERACWRNPPRFVVTLLRDWEDVKRIMARGYFRAGFSGPFVLLVRIDK